MSIITIPRFLVILLFCFIICGLGIIPFAVFIKPFGGVNVRESNGELVIVTLVMAILMLLFIFYIVYKASFFLIIFISKTKNTIRFFYPLRFKWESYEFKELLGFHFSRFEIKNQPIKVLVFRTTDGKTYKISDFEISNFRKIEKAALENFDLIRTDSLIPFEPEAKALFLANTNRKFDFEQAKESIYIYLIIIGIISFSLIYDLTPLNVPSRKYSGAELLGICALLVYFISRLWRAYRVMQSNR